MPESEILKDFEILELGDWEILKLCKNPALTEIFQSPNSKIPQFIILFLFSGSALWELSQWNMKVHELIDLSFLPVLSPAFILLTY